MEVSVEIEEFLPYLQVFLFHEQSLLSLPEHVKLGISSMVYGVEQGAGLLSYLEFSIRVTTCLLNTLVHVETSGRDEKSTELGWKTVSPYNPDKLGDP